MHKQNELKASPAGGIQGLALYAQQHTTMHQHKWRTTQKGITMHKHVGVHLQRDQDTCRVINKVINKRGKQMIVRHA